MKKILFLIIALVLVFGTNLALAEDNNATSANNNELEKILKPDEINKFQNIVKKGKELYGVRKQALEKIASPSDISNFQNIIKKGKELYGMRKSNDQSLVRPEATTCVKSALDKKDTALTTGVTNGSATLITIINARNACQKVALDKTTAKEQKEANKICVETYKKAIQVGKEKVKKTQEAIWKTFKADLRVCGQLQKATGDSADIKLDDGGLGIEL